MDTITLVESFNERCSLWRYRCPADFIEDLQGDGSRYSPEFEVGGTTWRIHLQHRTAAAPSNEIFLAVHLQCCSAKGAYGHFRVTVCNRDPALSKSKTFHCHFKKAGSAWGLHHFVSLDTLLSPDRGFLDYQLEGDNRLSRRPSVAIELVLHVLEPGSDGVYSLGQLPHPTYVQQRGPSSASTVVNRTASRSQPQPQMAPPPPSAVTYQDPYQHVKATLVYPFEHLESLCDMWFDVQGVKVKAHRCVIAARMSALLPPSLLPLGEGCTVAMDAPMDVFSAFIRFVYAEEYPEAGVLRAEALLDLYLLGAQCEFYDLCGVCLKLARPLLTVDNILPIVLTRYNSSDEVLTAMYLRVLLDLYDSLIQDKQFEEIPGHLFRRLSLILRDKERLPAVTIPAVKNTLGRQLAVLAETGEYSDLLLPISESLAIPVHKFIMASRSVVFSHAFNPRSATAGTLPALDGPEFQFSARCWQKTLSSIYRRHMETQKDLSAEDIAILFKLQNVLTMDGSLRKEADGAITPHNALRVLIYAIKHDVADLRERAMMLVSHNFHAMARQDPQAWDLIAELPQPAVVTMFRMVTDAMATGAGSYGR